MAKGSEDIILIENKPFVIKSAKTNLQGNSIEVNHITPALNENEYALRSEDIENDLYDVFVKYRSCRP